MNFSLAYHWLFLAGVALLALWGASLLAVRLWTRRQIVKELLRQEGDPDGVMITLPDARDEDRAALLARLSAGRLGWAVAAHTTPELWLARTKYLDDLLTLTSAGHLGRLAYAETLSRNGDEIALALGLWAAWWRDVLLVQSGLPQALLNLDRKTQVLQQAALFRPEQVTGALTDLTQTLRRIKANVNARLALDVLVLRLPKPAVP